MRPVLILGVRPGISKYFLLLFRPGQVRMDAVLRKLSGNGGV